jgi:hypothetical protein
VLRPENVVTAALGIVRMRQRPLLPRLTPADEEAHGTFLASLGKDPLWLRYRPIEQALAS